MKQTDSNPIQSTLSTEYLAKIDDWARKLGHPRAKMIRMLIEAAVDDQAWILNLVTSRLGLKVVDMVRAADGDKSVTVRNKPVSSK